MNDAFLYGYRRQPRPAFAERLYRRIAPRPLISVSISPARQMAQSVAVMAAAFLVMVAVSPRAREQFVRIG